MAALGTIMLPGTAVRMFRAHSLCPYFFNMPIERHLPQISLP